MRIIPDRKFMKIAGRTTGVGDTLYLGYSGAYVEFEAETSQIRATLCTDREVPEEAYRAWAAVYVDGGREPAMRFALTKPEQTFTVFEEKEPRKVRLRLVKLSEAAFGSMGICCIETEGNAPVIPTAIKKRKIEIIGDSITCGYGNEGVLNRDVFCTAQENPEDAYGILTANALDADYQLVSWSGIGVISDWVPETAEEPLTEILMPDLYRYRDLRLSDKLGLPGELWNPAEFRPDLVILHLGTNDDSYVRNKTARREYFGERYFEFLKQIHEVQPEAAILCILGVMGQNLCQEEERRVRQFREEYPDVRAEFFKLPEQLESDGIGADSHPSKATHAKTAGLLTGKIRDFMGW